MTYAISYPDTTNDRARIDRIYRSAQNNESNEVTKSHQWETDRVWGWEWNLKKKAHG